MVILVIKNKLTCLFLIKEVNPLVFLMRKTTSKKQRKMLNDSLIFDYTEVLVSLS